MIKKVIECSGDIIEVQKFETELIKDINLINLRKISEKFNMYKFRSLKDDIEFIKIVEYQYFCKNYLWEIEYYVQKYNGLKFRIYELDSKQKCFMIFERTISRLDQIFCAKV